MGFLASTVLVVHSPSYVWLFATPWTAACQAFLSLTVSQSLPEFMSIELVMRSHPLSPSFPPALNLSQHQDAISSSVTLFSSCPQSFPASGSFPMSWLFASGRQSIGSFNFSISTSNEYSGLVFFRMDWFDLLGVQGTLKSLPQHQTVNSAQAGWSQRKLCQHPSKVVMMYMLVFWPGYRGKRLIASSSSCFHPKFPQHSWHSHMNPKPTQLCKHHSQPKEAAYEGYDLFLKLVQNLAGTGIRSPDSLA